MKKLTYTLEDLMPDLFTETMPDKELTIWLALVEAEPESYLVGGAVRDIMMGTAPKDWDFTTKLRPEEVIALFEDEYNVDLVGESFGVVMVDQVEIATFRQDDYAGLDHKDVDILYVGQLVEDLARRDFTFNAMALNLWGELTDPYNGTMDIHKKQVSFVGFPPARIFEDPNRMLRAARFSARFDFEITEESSAALRYCQSRVDAIASERIGMEIWKTLSTAPRTRRFWETIQKAGLLERIIPELNDCYGHEGGRFHPETVWDHIIDAVDSISPRFPLVRLAALFHDIGKPQAFKENDDGSFIYHEVISSKIAARVLVELKFDNDTINAVVGLVRSHMRLGFYNDSNRKAYRRTVKAFADRGVEWRDFLRLKIADNNSNQGSSNYTLGEIRRLATPWVHPPEPNLPVRVTQLSVKGGELIEYFSLERGPIVGELHRFLLDQVILHGEKINNRETLLLTAKEWLDKNQETK